MTDEQIAELMGWPDKMKIEPGDMAYRVRALVLTAERREREACAKVAEDTGTWLLPNGEFFGDKVAANIRKRSNVGVNGPSRLAGEGPR